MAIQRKKAVYAHFQFQQSKLSLSGCYQVLQTYRPIFLLEEGKKQLVWHCCAPQMAVDYQIAENQVRGLECAESLTLNFFPWQLPMDELYWGAVYIAFKTEQPDSFSKTGDYLIDLGKLVFDVPSLYFPQRTKRCIFECDFIRCAPSVLVLERTVLCFSIPVGNAIAVFVYDATARAIFYGRRYVGYGVNFLLLCNHPKCTGLSSGYFQRFFCKMD